MLKVRNLVPNIYYDESRDFQIFGRSFEVVYNYLKTNVDLVAENPLDARSSELLIKLLTKTLGFETKHEYNVDNLRVLCSVFMRCLKNKGTKKSIEDAIRALLNAQSIDSTFRVKIDDENKCVQVYLPKDIRDAILLVDLFDYILPAGMIYEFIYGDYGYINRVADTFSISEEVSHIRKADNTLGSVLDATNVPDRTDESNLSSFENANLSQTFTGATASPAQTDPSEVNLLSSSTQEPEEEGE